MITDNYDEFRRSFHSLIFPELLVPDGHPQAFRKVMSVSYVTLFFELLDAFYSMMGIINSALFYYDPPSNLGMICISFIGSCWNVEFGSIVYPLHMIVFCCGIIFLI